MTPTVWMMAFLGAGLLWAAMPPLDLWPLAWVATIPWIWLIRCEQLGGRTPTLPTGPRLRFGLASVAGRLARRPYLTLGFAGFAFWMGALHWLRLPDPATSIGWVALSFYFAFYLPAFVSLSRVAVHRLRVPVVLATPVVWTGLELARGRFLSGMTMGSLCHTQYRWTGLVQVSDLTGAYGVSFVMMLVSASLARALPLQDAGGQPSGGRRWIAAAAQLALAAVVLAAAFGYGHLRMAGNMTDPGPRIALIQGAIDVKMQYDKDMRPKMFEQYVGLSRRAVDEHRDIDLLVWPESMFPEPLVTFDGNPLRPANFEGSDSAFRQWLHDNERRGPSLMGERARDLGVPLLLGSDTWHFGAAGSNLYNSAVAVARDGRLLGRYDKMHLVPFGEYVPFADWWPWLQRLTPLPISVTPGEKPLAIDVHYSGNRVARIAPNICYETVLPQVIRRQVNGLAAEGREPDILINLTNDGWFWGSSELDMHLACGVFRAVECRKPLLVAANTGFSAWIDSDGRILEKGPRRQTGVLVARPGIDHRRSPYLAYGDWPAGICLAVCALLAAVGLYGRRR
ncbi:MAG: apolipoprotein N-acyltransferase [Thermoguttaceae bacterium]